MAFVVTEGQLTAVERPAAPGPSSIYLADGISQDYAAIWRSQPNLRTVVDFLARNIAQIGLHVFERVSDTQRRRLADHPLAALIERPNPRTTRYRLLDRVVHDLGIFDNAVLLKLRGPDGRMHLVRLPVRKVTPVGESWLFADAYRLRGSRGFRDFPADQVVHLHGYNPDDDRWGVSPIETLRRVLSEEYAANTYREQLWRNGARFSGYLKRPKDAPRWDDTARRRFRADWQSQYAGSGPGAGGTPILEDGMEFASAAVTPEQAQYLEARKLTREEVAAAYHIPLPMVGILDHATFSNITEQHKQLYQDTLGPWLTMIQEELELQLLPDLDTSGRVYVEFNLAEKMRGSFEEQAQVMQTATGAPWLTRNEARARQNLAPLPGGDQLVTPLNVLVGGQASPRDSAPKRGGAQVKARAGDAYEKRYADALAAFFARQGAAVLSALGAGRNLDDAWDGPRWHSELSGDLYRLNAMTATVAGRATLERLGLDADSYDEDVTLGWLLANAEGVAEGVNGRTRAQLADAGDKDARASVFDVAVKVRAAQVAVSQVTAVSGFGTVEAARQHGIRAEKTWHAGPKARPSHAAMDGQTVPVGELFSNGARWPGDSLLSEDERAGCNCQMTVQVPEE